MFFLKIVPKFPLSLHIFFVFRLNGKNGGDGSDDFQIENHIVPELLRLYLHDITRVYHQTIDSKLLIQSSNHYGFVDRLIVSTDIVVIEVFVAIINLLHMGKRKINKKIIHIEGVLRKDKTGIPKEFRTVNYGVHEDILPQIKALHFIPAENFFFREGVAVGHYFFIFLSYFVVDEVRNEQVNAVSGKSNVSDFFQNL